MVAGASALVEDDHVWSHGEPGRSVLAATADGHVGSRNASFWSLLRLVTWSSDRLSDMSLDDIAARQTAASITSLLLPSSLSSVLAPYKPTVHDVLAGVDTRVAACFTVVLCPWLYGRMQQISGRNCIIILLIQGETFTLEHHSMRGADRSGDVLCSPSQRSERTFTSL